MISSLKNFFKNPRLVADLLGHGLALLLRDGLALLLRLEVGDLPRHLRALLPRHILALSPGDLQHKHCNYKATYQILTTLNLTLPYNLLIN